MLILAGSPSNCCFTPDCCTFNSGNLVTWREKQIVVARLSAESGYHSVALTLVKLIGFAHLLQGWDSCLKVESFVTGTHESSLLCRYGFSVSSIQESGIRKVLLN